MEGAEGCCAVISCGRGVLKQRMRMHVLRVSYDTVCKARWEKKNGMQRQSLSKGCR